MKLLSYRTAGADRFGIGTDDGIVDLTARLGSRYPDLKSLLGDADGLALAVRAAKGAAADHAPDEVATALPIPNPAKIFCVGRNYRAYHEVVETGAAPAYPSIFGRFLDGFVAHGEALLSPRESEQYDYEGELCAVIGMGGRHIPVHESLDHVAGYTVMNEGSARDWANRGTQNTPAKNFFKSGAIGPWMVTADEVGDPGRLRIVTRRNGAVVQDGGTDLMIFDLPYLISHISKFTPLSPGDLLATGSPGGSIIEADDPQWLKPGDRVEVEIAGIGTLSNPVEAE